MRITFKAPFHHTHSCQVQAPQGCTLGVLLASQRANIRGVLVGEAFLDHWEAYTPGPQDRLTVFLEVRAVELGTAILYAAITAVISTAVSIGLQYLLRALIPTPHREEGRPESTFGISGRTNTTAQGTPKPLTYGVQRVYGHILTTRVGLADGGRRLSFGILYGMGEGPIGGMQAAQIDDIDVSQYSGIETYTRLGGADNATLIHPDFATLAQVWSDGRQLPLTEDVIYQTRSSRTNALTLFFSIPLLRTAGGGAATQIFQVDYRAINAGTWLTADATLTWGDNTQSPRFFASRRYELPASTQWLFRIRLLSTTNQEGVLPSLYNVMEEQGGDPTYPNQALLAFRGISSAQIQSFDGMRGSAVVAGRLVPIWNGTSFTTAWTQSRAWILYDLLTHPRVGLGHRLDAAGIDLPSFLAAQQYWETQAGDHVGFPKDRCDVLINDRRPAWDWIKMLLSEGRAALIPSQGLLKLVLDKADDPGLLYSSPGNMLEGSPHPSQGTGQGLLPNTLLLQFPDLATGYRPHLLTYRAPGTESEPQREAPSLTLYTITNFAHAWWMARYTLLRQRLVQRHLEWRSPLSALVSEPLDHVWVSYLTPTFARGISGFLSADSTPTRLVLDQLATLAPATPSVVLVRHQATNAVEVAPVTTGAGTWGALELASPLSVEPQAGDLYAVGVRNVQMQHLVIEDVVQEGEEGWRLTGSLYEPTLYDYPTPPANPLPPPPVLAPPEEGGPVGGAGPPGVPALRGAAVGGAGVFTLAWSVPAAAGGDTLSGYEVHRSLVDESSFVLLSSFDAFTTTTATIGLSAWYAVRALAAMGGPGAFSNHVQATV